MLDTDFSTGRYFFETWRRWHLDAEAPRTLHYVAFCDSPPSVVQLLNAPAGDPALLELAQALAAQWTGLTAGFHRLMLAHGQLMLTLCVGPVPALLRQQQFHADAILLHSLPPDELVASGPSWTFKALGQCCRRGPTISFMTEIDPATLAPRLRASGIQLKPSVPGIDQADAGRLIHGLGHVIGQLSDAVINFDNRLRHFFEADIRETQNG